MRPTSRVAAALSALLLTLGCGGPARPASAGPDLLVKDFTARELLPLASSTTAAGARVSYDAAAGAQELAFAGAAPGQQAAVRIAGPWDLSGHELLALELGFERAETLAEVELVVHFDREPDRPGASRARALVVPAGRKLPRATYPVPRAAFAVEGTAGWSRVEHVEVRLRRAEVMGASRVHLFRVDARPRGKAQVLVTFDDATATAFTTAYPILAAAGLRGTVFANGTLVGSDPWFMTLRQLQAMDAAGWDVGSHGFTHAPLAQEIWGYRRSGELATLIFSLPHAYQPGDTLVVSGCDAAEYDGAKVVLSVPDPQTVTFATAGLEPDTVARGHCRVEGGVPAATVREELLRNRDWLAANGFHRAKDHLAYPFGMWDAQAIAIFRDELGGRTARAVGPGNAGRHVLPLALGGASPYLLPSFDLGSGTTAAAALGQVDAAVQTGTSIVFLGHGVAASAPFATQMLEAEFQALVDGLAARRDAGLLEVVTISEWAEGR